MNIIDASHDETESLALYEMLDLYSEMHGFNTRTRDAIHYLFVAQDEQSRFLGGIQGKINAGWMDIYTLYTTRTVKGTGSLLLKKAERYAEEKGCKGVKLITYPFQAPAFYQKHDYTIYAEVPDVTNNSIIIYMKKHLS